MLEGWSIEGAYNFGPDVSEQKTVIQVAQGLIQILGQGGIEIIPDKEKLHEAGLLQLNCDRAKSDLGWSPRLDFSETLNMTGEWYKSAVLNPSPELLTKKQISNYFKELK
jgi:CDP-glucose 4,6-dehydratase